MAYSSSRNGSYRKRSTAMYSNVENQKSAMGHHVVHQRVCDWINKGTLY